MTVRELLTKDIDIDVVDDVCESLYIAFCGPIHLTPLGEIEFAGALDLEVEMHPDNACSEMAIIHVDDYNEQIWRKNLREAKHLFNSAAGYCAADDYDKWFEWFEEVHV